MPSPETVSVAPLPVLPTAPRTPSAFRECILRFPTLIASAAMLVVTSIVAREFWAVAKLQNLLLQDVPLLVISIGVTFVLISGGFDLSIGAVYAAAAIFYLSLDHNVSAPVAVLFTLLLGTGIGAVNGLIINRFQINTFIATLGTSSVITSVMTLYVGQHVRYETTDSLPFSARPSTPDGFRSASSSVSWCSRSVQSSLLVRRSQRVRRRR